MAFTTAGLNEFLQGLKENFTPSIGCLVALRAGTGAFIDVANIEFGTIANGAMDITGNAVLEIPGGDEVGFLALYTGQVTDQSSLDAETKLAEIAFTQGTYVFTNTGTLTVTSFEISVVSN